MGMRSGAKNLVLVTLIDRRLCGCIFKNPRLWWVLNVQDLLARRGSYHERDSPSCSLICNRESTSSALHRRPLDAVFYASVCLFHGAYPCCMQLAQPKSNVLALRVKIEQGRRRRLYSATQYLSLARLRMHIRSTRCFSQWKTRWLRLRMPHRTWWTMLAKIEDELSAPALSMAPAPILTDWACG